LGNIPQLPVLHNHWIKINFHVHRTTAGTTRSYSSSSSTASKYLTALSKDL